MSLLHSISVIFCVFEAAIVTGPFMLEIFCLLKRFTRLAINVDFPTRGGPKTLTTTGAGFSPCGNSCGIW